MARIPQKVQDFLTGKMAWVATAASDGMPNATPKGSVQLIDDEHLAFADLFSRKTRENLLANPKVSITVADQATYKGYQIKGYAKILESGPLFEQMAEGLKKAPIELPPLQYVVHITVESVYDQSVGPEAGLPIVDI